MNVPDTDRVADDLAIRQVLARYARAVDRMNPDELLGCYHPGALDHHGFFDGPAEEFVPWCMDEVAKYSMTYHLLAQTAIDFDPDDVDIARTETYAIAFHRRDDGPQSDNWQMGLRYVDRFERRPHPTTGRPDWRIAERWVVGDWFSLDPIDGHRRPHTSLITGSRGRQSVGTVGSVGDHPVT